MPIYSINFSMSGKIHSCTGESSYPNKLLYESGEYDKGIVQGNINQFVKLYKEQYGFDTKSSHTVLNCNLIFE
jgi:hypothetical protein|nr:MAG TPA: hypothetical protein [Bacteriophage sp.]